MQITDIRVGFNDLLLLKVQHQTQLTVRRRVLGTEVDDQFVVIAFEGDIFKKWT